MLKQCALAVGNADSCERAVGENQGTRSTKRVRKQQFFEKRSCEMGLQQILGKIYKSHILYRKLKNVPLKFTTILYVYSTTPNSNRYS